MKQSTFNPLVFGITNISSRGYPENDEISKPINEAGLPRVMKPSFGLLETDNSQFLEPANFVPTLGYIYYPFEDTGIPQWSTLNAAPAVGEPDSTIFLYYRVPTQIFRTLPDLGDTDMRKLTEPQLLNMPSAHMYSQAVIEYMKFFFETTKIRGSHLSIRRSPAGEVIAQGKTSLSLPGKIRLNLSVFRLGNEKPLFYKRGW